MTFEEYYAKYGYQRDQPGWETLSDTDKDMIKDKVPIYQGPGQQEQQMAQDWWSQAQAGPDIDIWKGLSEVFGYKPGAIKQFAMGKFRELLEKPDFAKEYGLGKKALTQQLMEAERGLASKFAARGLLDSSAHAQAVGGAMGGYTQGLANLMLGKAGMEEQARQSRFGQAMGMVGQGLTFADFLNAQYLQGMGLEAQAINYLAGERGQQNLFNLQRYGMNPNPNNPLTGADVIPGIAGIGLQAAQMFSPTPFNFNWNAGGGGGGGGTEQPLWEDIFSGLF